MYDYFHRKLLKRGFAMVDETRVQVLNEEGRKAQSFMWLFRSGEVGFRYSSCMAIPRPGAAARQRNFWTATAGIWKPTVIRGTTACQGLNGVPAGPISAGTLSIPFREESSMITAILQYRVSSTTTVCLP